MRALQFASHQLILSPNTVHYNHGTYKTSIIQQESRCWCGFVVAWALIIVFRIHCRQNVPGTTLFETQSRLFFTCPLTLIVFSLIANLFGAFLSHLLISDPRRLRWTFRRGA